jgi:hypothetical protein
MRASPCSSFDISSVSICAHDDKQERRRRKHVGQFQAFQSVEADSKNSLVSDVLSLVLMPFKGYTHGSLNFKDCATFGADQPGLVTV